MLKYLLEKISTIVKIYKFLFKNFENQYIMFIINDKNRFTELSKWTQNCTSHNFVQAFLFCYVIKQELMFFILPGNIWVAILTKKTTVL